MVTNAFSVTWTNNRLYGNLVRFGWVLIAILVTKRDFRETLLLSIYLAAVRSIANNASGVRVALTASIKVFDINSSVDCVDF
jgi:hypothetical protein